MAVQDGLGRNRICCDYTGRLANLEAKESRQSHNTWIRSNTKTEDKQFQGISVVQRRYLEVAFLNMFT